MYKINVTAPETPGATPTNHFCNTLREARKIAKGYKSRRDLTWQDVRIEKAATGQLIEYAGPPR
jgi:hypothetical protein